AGALLQLQRQGKIRAAAVSNFGVRDLTDMQSHLRPVVNQLAYSLLFRAIEHEILPLCRRVNVGVAPYSPLAEGLLAGRFRSAEDVPEGRARTRLFAGSRPQARHGEAGAEPEVFETIDVLCEKAGRLGCSLSQLALAWLLAQPGVPFAVVGARRPDQLHQNVGALELELNGATCQELAGATDDLKAKLGGNPDMWQAASRIR
ncbi:MAG: aldo/keto reductase, partial [Lentisphaerae bacterium]|nr:aldo/keto reductase [Lentisphaerota bacterium]